jgi:hypothetical protein
MEEVNGVEVERTPENDPSLVGATVAVMWSEAMVTMEQLRRQGGPEMNRILEILQRVIRVCPIGSDMNILSEDQAVLQKWDQMEAASHSGFA